MISLDAHNNNNDDTKTATILSSIWYEQLFDAANNHFGNDHVHRYCETVLEVMCLVAHDSIMA